jgi:hypothetical protein
MVGGSSPFYSPNWNCTNGTMNPNKKIQKLIDQAGQMAMEHVEFMARKILREHKNLNEFVMGMGTCFFSEGEENHRLETYAYMKPLEDFIDEWDETLGITGTPMRFTANGQKVTDW